MNEDFIPANLQINSRGLERWRAENHFGTVRDRATAEHLVIPPPPMAVEVKPEKIDRRNFGQPPMAHTNTSRRRD